MKKNGLIYFFFILSVQLIAQVNLTQSTLPIVVINTNNVVIPDAPKITANMKIIFNGAGQINRISDGTFHFNGGVGIELRGSTSQALSDKKPYSIEIRNALGQDTAIGLLGMPKESDWALIAPYSDKSLVRDVLMYQLAGSMMAWSPRTRFCEVVLNNVYMGVYVLTEKIKRDKDRVNISKADSTATTGDALTGGYILKIDKTTGNLTGFSAGFSSNYANIPSNPNNKTFFQYEYPSLDDIKPAQRSYIQSTVAEMERAMSLTQPSFSDPSVGYAKYWDTPSLVDFFILNELARNVDGYRLSTYFYKDRDATNGKFKMGPVWDFNIGLGNADYCAGSNTTGWAIDYSSICPNDNFGVPFWWRNLMADANFKKQVRSRWTSLRINELSNTRINTMIDSMTTILSDAPTRNFQKWTILGRYIWPNSFIGTSYGSEVSYLKRWLTDRIIWLDGQMATFPTRLQEVIENAVVYPNPSQSGFTFEYVLKSSKGVKLLIFNNLGQLIFQKTEQQSMGKCQLLWHDKEAASGVYFYEIQVDNVRQMAGKILKND